ncbi:MAG TPA: S53 family peptidase [Candidatus Tumulicola sp.]
MRFSFLSHRMAGAALAAGLLAACSSGGGGSTFSPSSAGNAPMSAVAAHGGTGAWTNLGAAPDSTQVDLAVVFKYRNDAKLETLVEDQADPSSGRYHRFLTPSQFAREYGPTQQAYSDAIGQLRAAGFTIGHQFANRTVLDVSAPAPLTAKYFATKIDLVRRGDGSVRHVNTTRETIPPALADSVLTVVGLDNAHEMIPQYAFKPGARTHKPAPRNKPRAAPLFGPDGGYGPRVFQASYNFPKNMDGSGRASAVVGDADFLDSDLAAYLAYFQVNRTGPATTRVLVDGGPPPGLTGDSLETTLDVETLVSIAPGTALYVYEVPGSPDLRYFADMYNQIVSDNKADTVNTSYSECETAFIPSFPMAANAIEKQGNALGITFHASTGDYGTITYGCSSTTSVGTPADTPHNVAIGGTILDVNSTTGQETSEVGWNDSSGATGGGISVVFTLPPFQRQVVNTIKKHRNIPDLSFDASPYTGESLYYGGSFDGPIGGTSLSSPIFGAGLTILDQVRHARAGHFTKTTYKTWKANGYGSGSTTYLRDITSGSIPPYSAKPGYDQMTGIGAMLFGNFVTLLH